MKYVINSGDKFGKFIAIEKLKYETPKGNFEWRWKCKDESGNIFYKRPRALYEELDKEKKKEEKIKNGEYLESMGINQLGLRKSIFKEYIRNAANREIPMNLTFDQFNSLINQNCYYCGAEPSVHKTSEIKSNKTEPILKHNGIDRLDSSLGYELDNCVPCCYICNRAKAQLDNHTFLEHITKIYNHRIKESSTTISKESTSETIADGNGVSPTNEENDIV